MEKEIIVSPLNYTGGKARLLPQILPLFPNKIVNFVDLFAGGGNVGVNVTADRNIYNDINDKVIGLLYTMKIQGEDFAKNILALIERFELSNTYLYGVDKYPLDKTNYLGKYNQENFMKLRSAFNSKTTQDEEYFYMLYVLIVYAFNNQIRFNSKNEYNMPVGKHDLNTRLYKKLTAFIEALQTQNSVFTCKNYLQLKLPKDSFVYLDPPYYLGTATYNERDGWNEEKELELLDYMSFLNKNTVPFALSNVLTLNGRENDLLIKWCEENSGFVKVHHLDFNYNNSNYHKKDIISPTDEVLITNY